MSPVLELDNVSFSFDGKTDVLSDISLRIDQGEMVGLVGGNGAGKSTLLWCALGLLHHRGTVRLFGQKRNAESSHRVGVVFQNPEDQLFMPTLLEDLTLPLFNRGIAREEAVARADPALQQAGLASLSNKSARQLSLGQRKRAAIAAELVCSPDCSSSMNLPPNLTVEQGGNWLRCFSRYQPRHSLPATISSFLPKLSSV